MDCGHRRRHTHRQFAVDLHIVIVYCVQVASSSPACADLHAAVTCRLRPRGAVAAVAGPLSGPRGSGRSRRTGRQRQRRRAVSKTFRFRWPRRRRRRYSSRRGVTYRFQFCRPTAFAFAVAVCVCLSRWYIVPKATESIIMQPTPGCSPAILVFPDQIWTRYLKGVKW